MPRRSEKSVTLGVMWYLVMMLMIAGLSSCSGLCFGRSPLIHQQPGGLSRSTSTKLFRAPHRSLSVRNNRISKNTCLQKSRKRTEGTELHGYLDNLDRASGINYNDYWGRKTSKPNATELVNSVQSIVESTPKPFNKIVSHEMWYVCFLVSSLFLYEAVIDSFCSTVCFQGRYATT